ncbi:YDG domain-containing protein [Gemmiger formicilis]
MVKVPTVAEREYNPDAALTDSDMTGGSVTGADGSSLAGTWSFTGTNIIPTVNNNGYQAVFTPNDTNNYNTVTRTITVKVTKATPVIAEKPTAGALTYGQKLSDSTLTGGKAAYQTADGTEITGTFAWKNDTTKPAVVDSQKTEYDVTFTPSDKDNYNAVDTKLTLSITKAAAPTNIPSGTLNIINGTYQTYTYDFAQLLPELSEGEYGTVSYGNQPAISLVSQSGYYYDPTIVEFHNGVLTLAQFYAKDGTMTGQIGTVKVKVTTTNYEDFQLTLVLNAVNQIKPTPDGTITASDITYGQTLSESTIKGKMKDDGKTVEGTFGWTNPSTQPDKAGDYQAEWTFTPAAGYEKYATVTGTVTVKVNKADPTFTAPTAQENLTYTGQEQALITAGMTDHGTMLYSLTENGTYSQDIPTGTDAGAYTVWYRVIGDENHNDTAPASVPVSIGKKPLTITGVTAASKPYSKPYDGTTNADISSVTFDGVNLNRGTDYTVTANFNDASVGNDKNITATVTLMDQAEKNYALEQSSFTTTGSITAKEVTVTITPNGGTYGSVTAAAAKLFGAVEGDNVPVTLTYTGNDYNSTTVPVNAGSYTVMASIADGNYTLTGNATADFVITPKAVTVSGITANDKVYDGTTNAVLDYSNAQFDGILENDKLTVAAKGMFEKAEAGKQNVAISDLKLSGASAANYVLAGSGNQTRTTATITAKEVPVTITPNGGTYGSVTAATAKLSGAVEGDNVPVTLTYTGNDYNSTTVPVNAGSYTVMASIADGNYTLTGNATADFVITPKAVTVSGITANDKVYDGTTNAVLDYSNAQFDGILENDKLTVAAKGMFEKAEAGKQNVAISDLKLGGDSAANYVLAESGNQTETTATITAKEVTVTPDNKSKVYEEKDPKLTYIVSGVLSGETLKGITLARAEGENAGEYDITATADAGANPNYEVTFAEGKFTINPKSIDGATVKLGKALTANGAEQTQTVEKVLLNDKELPADSYTVAGNTATDPGSHTLTITAKGNYTGAVEQTYVIVPAKAEDAPDKEITIGNGKVKVDIKFEGTVPPATLLTNKAELLAMLVDSGDITADELAQIANGASVDIVLTVKEANVSDEVKTAIAQAAKGYTIGQYLDISLFKYMTVNGSQQAGVPLHTTKDALTISVGVPDALINTNSAVNRTYCIVRNHEGTITVLDAAFDAAGKTLTFKTDRFSIYAIAYKDTAVPSSGSNPGSNNSSNDSETKKNEVAAPTPAPTPASTSKPSTITAMPQTGDTSNPTLYVVLLVASLLGLAVVFVCKKRNDK